MKQPTASPPGNSSSETPVLSSPSVPTPRPRMVTRPGHKPFEDESMEQMLVVLAELLPLLQRLAARRHGESVND